MPKSARRRRRGHTKRYLNPIVQRSESAPTAKDNTEPIITRRNIENFKNLFPLIVRLYWINGLILISALIVLAVAVFTANQSFRDTHPNFEFVASLVMGLWIFLVFVGQTMTFVYGRKHPLSLTEKWVRKFFKWERVVMASQFALATFLLIYRVGGIDLTAASVRTHWENASSRVVNLVSTVTSLMVSGIVGNFAYDMLK